VTDRVLFLIFVIARRTGTVYKLPGTNNASFAGSDIDMPFKRCPAGCLVAISIIIASAGAACAQEPFRLTPAARFLLGMEWSYLWLSGEMLIPAGGRPGSGSRVEVPAELGVDQGDATSITFDTSILDNHVLNFDYLMFAPTGIKRAPRTFRFHNKTYLSGTSLETRLDFNWFRLSYGYKLWDLTPWWIVPRIGVHHIRYSATLNGETDEDGIMSNTRSLDGTYPVVGLETRYSSPYGVDFGLELEGIHLITAGFLSMARLRVNWEIYPDVVMTLNGSSRVVQYIEDNQPLNNEWFYVLSGWSAGISFAF
jgi:hypothetical protein